MDRRQRKTREAILGAFSALLEKHPYERITVQEILDAADVGRSTFYAHFETKDFLIQGLCEELFGHIVDTAMGLPQEYYRCTCGVAGDSVFLHLLRHLAENDRHILALLSSPNNELFLRYFKSCLYRLVRTQLVGSGRVDAPGVPEELLVRHISASFVETVGWWLSEGRRHTPEELAGYFEAMLGKDFTGDR